ncbi:hypothetical protein D3C80_1209990 [compost metagenome]
MDIRSDFVRRCGDNSGIEIRIQICRIIHNAKTLAVHGLADFQTEAESREGFFVVVSFLVAYPIFLNQRSGVVRFKIFQLAGNIRFFCGEFACINQQLHCPFRTDRLNWQRFTVVGFQGLVVFRQNLSQQAIIREVNQQR